MDGIGILPELGVEGPGFVAEVEGEIGFARPGEQAVSRIEVEGLRNGVAFFEISDVLSFSHSVSLQPDVEQDRGVPGPTADSSEKPQDPAMFVNVNEVARGNRRKPWHGHDVPAQGVEEAGAH